MARRGLQIILAAFGVLAIVTGAMAAIEGPPGLLDGQPTTPTVDNELRFFAVYWLAFGVLTLSVVPRVEKVTLLFRGLVATMFAGALARLLSLVTVGRPHPAMLIAMVVNLVLPPLLVWWQAGIARRSVAAEMGRDAPFQEQVIR